MTDARAPTRADAGRPRAAAAQPSARRRDWRRTPGVALRRARRSAWSSWSSRSCGCCVSSFKPEAEVRAVPPTWWPRDDRRSDNYRPLFTKLDFPTYFINSAIVAVAVTLGNMVFCSMLGYALAKLRLPGQAGAVRARARHADGARRGDVRAAVRADHQHRPGQHAARA